MVLGSFFCSNSLYLNYIVQLNFWLTNTIFLLTIILVFVNKAQSLFSCLCAYVVFNLNTFTTILIKKKLLTTLVVGTIVLHPLMFYLFTTLFVFKYVYKTCQYGAVIRFLDTKLVAWFLSIALFLGGFWGLQSIAWGYLWVNDAIEWLLFLEIVYLMYKAHRISNQPLPSYPSLTPLFLLGTLLLVRLNFIQTRHSFISSLCTIYVVVFIYLSLLRLAASSHSLAKVDNVFGFVTAISMVLLTIVTSSGSYLLFFKYIWLTFLMVFLILITQRLLKRYSYLHMSIFIWSVAWSLHFTYFSLNYFLCFIVPTVRIFIGEFSCTLDSVYLVFEAMVRLDGVAFSLMDAASNLLSLLHTTSLSVILNNYLLYFYLAAVLYFFLKRVELRFLY